MINGHREHSPYGGLRHILVYALLIAAPCWAALSKPAGSSRRGLRTHEVIIEGFKFAPHSLTVEVGDTIIWRNQDRAPHTATADARVFDSGNIPNGSTWEYVAGVKGTYSYICALHPQMKAQLVVR